ncbi:MAG TPA: MFS transporter [Propionibacteriaceae bacterium]|nr:MFS transporter [Propionibacteriaceae bacterium]
MATTVATTRKAPNPWWVGLVCGMASYIDAASIVGTGIALVIYQHTIGLEAGQIGWLSGALTFFIAVGAIVGGKVGDTLGRRSVFIVTMALIAVGGGLATFATGFPLLLAGVALIGFGTGADLPVSLATIAEASSDANRGKIIGFSNMLWLVGIISAVAIATFFGGLGRLGGQLLFGQVAVIALLVLAARFGIPESPTWIEAKGLRGARTDAGQASRVSVRDLLVGRYAKPFFALLGFYALTNLAANTQGQFTTYLWVNVVGVSVQLSSLIGLLSFPLFILFGLWFMRIVDGRHRFVYFTVGAVAYAASYFIPAIFGFTFTTMITYTLLNGLGGAFAFEGIMKVWTQESFPTLLRTTAQGTILAVARFAAALLATVTPLLINSGPKALFAGLGAFVTVGVAIAWLVFHKAPRNQFLDDEVPLVAVGEPAFPTLD